MQAGGQTQPGPNALTLAHRSVKSNQGKYPTFRARAEAAGAPVESATHTMFLVPAWDLMEAIMANEVGRHGLLPYICCIRTNHDPSTSIHSGVIWMFLQLSAADTSTVLVAFLSASLSRRAH